MYKIIGADQREYGPVTAEQIQQWIAEGRLNGQSSTQAEGSTEWRLLSTFPEFDVALASAPPTIGAATPPPLGAQPELAPDLLSRDYTLDIGRCISDGWELLKSNFGLVFGGVAIYMLIEGGISFLGRIPFLGVLLSLANLVITGPFMGGVYFLLLKAIRRRPAEVGDVFSGFRLAFLQLFLGYVVVALLTLLAALPGLALMGFPIYVMVHQHAPDVAHVFWACCGFVIFIIPVAYLGVSWMFTLPLIIDKQLDFWPAMMASWKMVGKHWWLLFGLSAICAVINLVGFSLCCVGIFISLPVTLGALMYAYESIFSAPAAPAP